MFVTLPKVFDAMVGLATCILVGYFVKTKYVIDEVNENGENFKSKKLYDIMIKVVCPVCMIIILLTPFFVNI